MALLLSGGMKLLSDLAWSGRAVGPTEIRIWPGMWWKQSPIYVSENYWKGKGSAVRRYTLRLDGFVSVGAPMVGGSLKTKPIRFAGDNLYLNFSSSAMGDVRVEILDTDGHVIPGFSSADCDPIFGDTVKRKVSWSGHENLSNLAGKTIQLRFILKDADLYSFQFE